MPNLYLDYNATAPLRPEALEAMRPYLESQFGNPSSTHRSGQAARAALESARQRLASLLHCEAEELIFTSGGTESINLALRGARPQRKLIQSARSEHPAALRTIEALEDWDCEWLSLNAKGELEEPQFKDGLVSLMQANNETGVLHPVEALAGKAHAAGALFHCDAVQSFGKLPINLASWDVDFLSASAHKFGGPQGVGFLFVRRGRALAPLLLGGEQEGGLRAGTPNLAGIVGMVEAAARASAELENDAKRRQELRDGLETCLLGIPGLRINGLGAPRLWNTVSLLLPGIESDLMIMRLDQEGIQVSAGSACAAGALEPSHVMRAMGLGEAEAKCVLRLSWGAQCREGDLARVAEALKAAVQDFQKASI